MDTPTRERIEAIEAKLFELERKIDALAGALALVTDKPKIVAGVRQSFREIKDDIAKEASR